MLMKNTNLQVPVLCALLFIAIIFVSCKEEVVRGKGNVTTEGRTMQQFDKIIIDIAADATIEVGKPVAVEVKAQGNLMEHIKTEVNGNTLRIYNDGIIFNSSDISIIIQVPSLSALELKGAADVRTTGDIKGPDFKLEVLGVSEIVIDELHVDNLDVKLSGASELQINRGTVGKAKYKVAGTSEIRAEAVETKEVAARVSGAGEMSLFVTQKLDADITGTGEIDYRGHPKITSDVTGAGELINKN